MAYKYIYVINKFDMSTKEISHHIMAFSTEKEASKYCEERHANWLGIEYWYDVVFLGKMK